MDVSKRLRYLREQCGYTQNGLAERAGVSQTHLRRVELGQADITVSHLQLLCDAMSISLQEFFEESSDTDEIAATGHTGHCFTTMNMKPVSIRKTYPEFYQRLLEKLEK